MSKHFPLRPILLVAALLPLWPEAFALRRVFGFARFILFNVGEGELLTRGKQPNPFIDRRGYRRFISETEKAFRERLRKDQQSN
jgi:hypothetical protein